MTENKKSVVLYCDIIHTVNELTDEEAGKLFKHYLAYINDLDPEPPDKLTQIAFEPIKQNLKRDLVKYNQFIEKQRENGFKGGRPIKPKETQITQAFFSKPKKADNDNDNDNDIYYRKLKFSETLKPFLENYGTDFIKEFFDYWTEPNKSNTKFRQELQKTWSLEGRLATWEKNNKKFNKQTNQINNDEIRNKYPNL